ncbi:hypothetical protein C1752_09734 [Acaryochloris thomasi RCC1774]|uniref:TIGR00341 family protein n=1 Tax=Acaryochloris thomasi RCC1774 TaxID=1764569 RepID=A0A2W1JN89_9CYAN|nr:TIGR00341 family protein [Acaryochloris thomasi]PZD70721.1 hypothetical protein C1752_09734 [Acaryochloris thomasi RCC1774]
MTHKSSPSLKRRLLKLRFFRQLIRTRKKISEIWNQNSGDWSWVIEKKRPIAALNRSLWKASVPSLSFYALLSLSGVISTLGLLANSAAAIIGAMIIAPLMGPIIGMAYAMTVGNRRLLKRSVLTTFKGVILSVLTAAIITFLIGLKTPSSEILIRVRPTLIDLGVALAAGAAGAFAQSRRQVENALPGVAISVALVPPLSVIGIGIAWANTNIAVGATVLFATNLIGIILSGSLVFLFQSYGSLERARKSLVAGGVSLLILGVPLGWSLRNILVRQQLKSEINTLISRESLTFANTEIQRLEVRPDFDSAFVELDVAAPPGTISQKQVQLVRQFLVERLEQPVQLKVRVVPTEFFEDGIEP